MHRYALFPLDVDSLYIGGGTPSVLRDAAVGRIIETARAVFGPSNDAEITIEVNPGTVTPQTLAAYRRLGVNRLNIGVQSFDDARLAFLGRIHDATAGADAIRAARGAGFERIGIDLIFGLPGQTPADWRADLTRAISFAPEHLSCYLLSYEPGTPLFQRRSQKEVRPLGEARCADLYEVTAECLEAAGYLHYEVSNFARTDAFRSRHNSKYWSGAPYVGLGPSAHSYIDPVRWWNHGDVDAYIAALSAGKPAPGQKEVLNREQQMTEAIYLGLRTSDGIDPAEFQKKFNVDLPALFAETLAALAEDGLLHAGTRRLRLSRRGMLFLDHIAGMFVFP